MNKIKQSFNGFVNSQRLKAQRREDLGNTIDVVRSGEDLPGYPARLRFSDYVGCIDFTGAELQKILQATIQYDRLEMFQRVMKELAYTPNDTMTFLYGYESGKTRFTGTISLLAYAIKSRSESIALSLAQNPETDIAISGKSTGHAYLSGGVLAGGHCKTYEEDLPTPVEMARAANMGSVVAALEIRMMEAKQKPVSRDMGPGLMK